ncbi:MAG: prolyl oligopeptidase family serine peptidase [Holosporaceae bacterium]|nr:MAG: prolyl oligopeptidase family serine peptidase [Holosporaceae bacterium]
MFANLRKKYHLNLKQTLIIGFSSGGHLALWAASRYKIHKNSVLIRKNPISIHGVVSLAGVCDLKYFQNYDPECREIITKLVNYTHYDEACPTAFLPLNIKQILIGGDLDQDVPIETLKAYEKDAKRAGDIIEVHVVRDAGHFEFVVPGTDAHQKTVDEIRKFYR